MPDIHYRELESDDAEAVCALRLAGLDSDPSAFSVSVSEERAQPIASLRQALSAYRAAPDRAVFGAFDGTLVGMLGVERQRGERVAHKARLWGLYVAANRRRAGIATALVERAIDRLDTLGGVEKVLLEVSQGATAAIALYEQIGFRIFATETRALRVGEQWLAEHRMAYDIGALSARVRAARADTRGSE